MVTQDNAALGFVAADERTCRSCPSVYGSYCAACDEAQCLLISQTPVDLSSLAIGSEETVTGGSVEEIQAAIDEATTQIATEQAEAIAASSASADGSTTATEEA